MGSEDVRDDEHHDRDPDDQAREPVTGEERAHVDLLRAAYRPQQRQRDHEVHAIIDVVLKVELQHANIRNRECDGGAEDKPRSLADDFSEWLPTYIYKGSHGDGLHSFFPEQIHHDTGTAQPHRGHHAFRLRAATNPAAEGRRRPAS